MVLCLMSGCALGGGPARESVDVGREPGLVDASVGAWDADPARLVDDIPRAFKKMHWGKLSIKEGEGGVVSDAAPGEGGEAYAVRAEALLLDGRTASVLAWGEGSDSVVVAVRVGHFGDAEAELGFLDALAGVMRGEPRRQYGGHFELP